MSKCKIGLAETICRERHRATKIRESKDGNPIIKDYQPNSFIHKVQWSGYIISIEVSINYPISNSISNENK